MKTFDCPKCGAPVTYDPNLPGSTARCAYCQSQLALPDELRGRPAQILSQIDINIGPQIASTASKLVWVGVLIFFLMVLLLLRVILWAFTTLFLAAPVALFPIA